ncbi:hypothetical protein C0995_007508 [Termitomyces sp. Mi166|nr:hypothetical protein C0995_007508 [Termitomyces sp. Mi166\
MTFLPEEEFEDDDEPDSDDGPPPPPDNDPDSSSNTNDEPYFPFLGPYILFTFTWALARRFFDFSHKKRISRERQEEPDISEDNVDEWELCSEDYSNPITEYNMEELNGLETAYVEEPEPRAPEFVTVEKLESEALGLPDTVLIKEPEPTAPGCDFVENLEFRTIG